MTPLRAADRFASDLLIGRRPRATTGRGGRIPPLPLVPSTTIVPHAPYVCGDGRRCPFPGADRGPWPARASRIMLNIFTIRGGPPPVGRIAARHPSNAWADAGACFLSPSGTAACRDVPARGRPLTEGTVPCPPTASNRPTSPKATACLPAIAQDAQTGEVLMLAYMNRESYAETLATGRAVYFSRSRSKLWRKGEESGHVQQVKAMFRRLRRRHHPAQSPPDRRSRLPRGLSQLLLSPGHARTACRWSAVGCSIRKRCTRSNDSHGSVKPSGRRPVGTCEIQLPSLDNAT